MPNDNELYKYKLLKKLPLIFQDEESFLSYFLKGFEDLLLGKPWIIKETPDSTEFLEKYARFDDSRAALKSIYDIIDNIDKYFDAFTTPPQFLEYLAGWVGYKLRDEEEYHNADDIIENQYIPPNLQHLPLNEERSSINRLYISEMVKLYKKRGTYIGINEFIQEFIGMMTYNIKTSKMINNLQKENEDFEIQIINSDTDLELFLRNIPVRFIMEVRIDEYIRPFILGETSILGVDTILGDPLPYYFTINIKIQYLTCTVIEYICLMLENEAGENDIEIINDEDFIITNGEEFLYLDIYKVLLYRIIEDINNILDDEKPAHISFYFVIDIYYDENNQNEIDDLKDYLSHNTSSNHYYNFVLNEESF